MTPEERTNQYYLWVLERIKEEILTTPSNKPLVYELSHIAAAGVPNKDTEANIVRKLHEWKAIRIIEDSPGDWRGSGRHIFKLKVLEPKFTEIYNYYQRLVNEKDNNQPREEDFEKEVDEFLNSKNQWALGRIWKIVNSLNGEWQLRDQEVFDIPHDKFERNKITSYDDQEGILTNLHIRKFIQVRRMLGQTPPTNDLKKPQASVWATIIDKPEIIKDASTKIEIYPQKFKILVEKLHARVKPDQAQGQQINTPQTWLDDFQWISDTEFSLGNNDPIKFGKSDSDRINLFKMLVNARGNWVEVKAMAGQIKKTEGPVRVTIGQINNENLKNKIIEIVERNDKDKPGAYRINIK